MAAGKRGRTAKACAQCRALKTRCIFSDGSARCDKCIQRNVECTVIAPGVPVSLQSSAQNSTVLKRHREDNKPVGTDAVTGAVSSVGSGRGSPHDEPVSAAPNPASRSTAPQPISPSMANPSMVPHHHRSGSQASSSSQTTTQTLMSPRASDLPPHAMPQSNFAGNGSYVGYAPAAYNINYRNSYAAPHNGSMSNLTSPTHPNMVPPSQMAYSQPGSIPIAPGSYSSMSPNIGNVPGGHPMSSTTTPSLPPQPWDPSPPIASLRKSSGMSSESSHSAHHPLQSHRHSMQSLHDVSPDPRPDLEQLIAASEVPGADSVAPEPSAEYFLNLGVFSDHIEEVATEQPLENPQQYASTAQSDTLGSVIPDSKKRFRFQVSPAYMALQAIDPVSRQNLGQVSKLLQASPRVSPLNVISQGILTREQVIHMFELFKGNYDHWISLPNADINMLVNYLLAQCPLLVTTCCSVAMRFGLRESWQALYPRLAKYLTSEFAATLIEIPQNVEFLQALTIMAKYADSLSYGEFSFDTWYISGLGIQHLNTMASLGGTFTYFHLRLWNHLVLAHLSACNLTGRKSLVDESGIALCRRIFSERGYSRFDSCMVAELMIQALAYKYFSYGISYGDFEDGVAVWQREWGVLAQLPMIQFVEPVLLYCCFLVRWTRAHRRSNALPPSPSSPKTAGENQPISPVSPRDVTSTSATASLSTAELLSELITLNTIVKALLEMVHENYFACLSDQLHNVGFTSVVFADMISKVILSRERSSPQIQQPIAVARNLAERMALRFHHTSRGADIARTRSAALQILLDPNAKPYLS